MSGMWKRGSVARARVAAAGGGEEVSTRFLELHAAVETGTTTTSATATVVVIAMAGLGKERRGERTHDGGVGGEPVSEPGDGQCEGC